MSSSDESDDKAKRSFLDDPPPGSVEWAKERIELYEGDCQLDSKLALKMWFNGSLDELKEARMILQEHQNRISEQEEEQKRLKNAHYLVKCFLKPKDTPSVWKRANKLAIAHVFLLGFALVFGIVAGASPWLESPYLYVFLLAGYNRQNNPRVVINVFAEPLYSTSVACLSFLVFQLLATFFAFILSYIYKSSRFFILHFLTIIALFFNIISWSVFAAEVEPYASTITNFGVYRRFSFGFGFQIAAFGMLLFAIIVGFLELCVPDLGYGEQPGPIVPRMQARAAKVRIAAIVLGVITAIFVLSSAVTPWALVTSFTLNTTGVTESNIPPSLSTCIYNGICAVNNTLDYYNFLMMLVPAGETNTDVLSIRQLKSSVPPVLWPLDAPGVTQIINANISSIATVVVENVLVFLSLLSLLLYYVPSLIQDTKRTLTRVAVGSIGVAFIANVLSWAIYFGLIANGTEKGLTTTVVDSTTRQSLTYYLSYDFSAGPALSVVAFPFLAATLFVVAEVALADGNVYIAMLKNMAEKELRDQPSETNSHLGKKKKTMETQFFGSEKLRVVSDRIDPDALDQEEEEDEERRDNRRDQDEEEDWSERQEEKKHHRKHHRRDREEEEEDEDEE
jgi:hypothetical protein